MTEFSTESLTEMEDDDLYVHLGALLLGEGSGFAAADHDRFRRYGTRWFQEKLPQLRERLCDDTTMQEIYAPTGSDRVVDYATIADAVSGIAGHPMASILAVLVVRYGLKRLCAGS